ncbi:hypothetical protein [Neisseria yangbaofengii]|uniref:hypothetical protein n=1 Tax=Neisseria yangbaofengii TaxID=2709396 RepID=UPI0013ECAD52|nr:hypothetical protein [Neisseria yangbaofengii]
MKKLLALSAVFFTAACSSPAPVLQKTADYNPQTQARIRIYGQNQKPSTVEAGIDCNSGRKGQKFSTGGSLGEAFGSLTGTVKSQSIGIAPTETSKRLGEKNGILSRAFFREFVIPAGKAANVQAFYVGLTNVNETPTHVIIMKEGSCQSKKGSFVPQAGKDYEVIGVDGRACGVAVYEVSSQGNLKNIPLNEAVSCRK